MSYDLAFKHFAKEADKFKRDTLRYAVEDKADILWDQTNLNFKYQFPKDYYKIAVVMPYVSWERTEQVNTLRRGKTISKEVWKQFAVAYDCLWGRLIEFPSGMLTGFDETIFAPSFELVKKVG